MPETTTAAAECLGVKVPDTRFLNETRINRINNVRYEGQEIEGSLHVIEPGDTVLEIGAGIGLVGAVIAHNAEPKAVHSFEANPELIPVINAMYEMNGLTDRISVRNEVLFSGPDRPKEMQFHLRKSYLGSSLLNPDERPSTVVDIPTADFTEVCETLEPNVLVMDIEGGELELLRHADLSRFRAIVLEFHPKIYEVKGMRQCKRMLRNAGFEPVEEKSTRTVWACLRT